MARSDKYSDQQKEIIAQCKAKKNARRKKRKKLNAAKRLQKAV